MSASGAGFGRSYERALRAYLERPREETLRPAYELGREAVALGLSVLEISSAHHDALAAALEEADAGTVARVVALAGAFLAEALAAFEMVQRGYREAREAMAAERRQAAMLRQLSNFLADASLALGGSDAFIEMAHLVAEQARELAAADRCVVLVSLARPARIIRAESPDGGTPPVDVPGELRALGEAMGPARSLRLPAPDRAAPARGDAVRGEVLATRLTALGGEELGFIEVSRERAEPFTELDEALIVHLAQMVSATVERARDARAR